MAEAELPTIARPYAKAAFLFARDQDGALARWSNMLALLAAAVVEPVIQEAIEDPMRSAEDEAQLLIDLLGEDLDSYAANFLHVLAGYDRIALLPNVAEAFELLKAAHEKTVEVEVTSAFDVTDAEVASLEEALRNKLQRNVSLHTEVDATLLGGVVIRAEDTVFDNSVRGKLDRLAQVLS